KRREQKAQTGVAFQLGGQVRQAIKRILPFHPTNAQKRALKEIAGDMQKPSPMRRLLQGDVGSGKTLVAFEAAIIAIENGYQVALMAPTEILAQQHYFSARRILEPSGYRIVLLTGSLEDERKRETRRHIAQGNAQLVIGTHALIEQKVEFAKLGLVILDEMPPGRTPIVTRRVGDERSEEVWQFVRKQVAAGHQTYVVYPVIEENEENELKAAMKMYGELSKRVFADLRVAVLHGRMDSDLKEQVMRLFQKGEIQILVSTTVIEVGVDVSNATVMVIEHAER